MDEVMAIWAEWLKPSAGLPTVQWSILLAIAAAAGHLLQRATGLPKVVGYSLVGTLAGLAGFSGAAWPLQGVALFLLELGVSVVLFEAGGRIEDSGCVRRHEDARLGGNTEFGEAVIVGVAGCRTAHAGPCGVEIRLVRGDERGAVAFEKRETSSGPSECVGLAVVIGVKQ